MFAMTSSPSDGRRSRRTAKTQPVRTPARPHDSPERTAQLRLQDTAGRHALTITVDGPLDSRISAELWRTLRAAAGNRKRIVVDLEKSRSQDDTGFALLSVFVRRARATGIEVAIANVDAGKLSRWPSLVQSMLSDPAAAPAPAEEEDPPRVASTWLMMRDPD